MANPAQMKKYTHHGRRDREKRKRLILLVRILMKYLRSKKMHALLQKVQGIVKECTSRHRMGDASVSPLQDIIESRLQLVIDTNTWTQVISCLELYMSHRHNRSQHEDALLRKTTSKMVVTGTPSDSSFNRVSV